MTIRPLHLRVLLVALGLVVAAMAFAQTRDVRIDITTGQGQRIRIQCEPLQAGGNRDAGASSVEADEVLANDLDWSAVFAVHRTWSGEPAPAELQAIVSGRWTVEGSMVKLAGEVRDLPGRKLILARDYRGPLKDRRALVHRFADDIVLQFTGEAGVAQTRIAYATVASGVKELHVMDYDGANRAPLTADRSIATSPSWSYDGSLLLFTSYRGGKGPQLFVVPSAGGKVFAVSTRGGINTSASYSPDGREIACTLSFEGSPDIYMLDARGGAPRRLTHARGIDTSPAWSPTGQEIAFTSDRTGVSQVYVMDREGGNVRRLTFEVDNTDSPSWSPAGDRIAFVSRTGGGFDIWICRVDGSGARPVVTGGSNENPKWSPDGRHLVFSSNREGAPSLFVTDLDERAPRKLDTAGAAVSPAWSPRPGSASSAAQAGPERGADQGGIKR